jgi:ubiquinone/menaquinone biosynthesis C-methylase UbiE
MDDPKQLVADSYDRIAERYAAWAGAAWDGDRARYGALLFEHLPAGASVLDLGCGPGVSTTRELAKRFAVTGVDVSGRNIELARKNVPQATFLQADMATVDFPPDSFDAVVAFYSLIHLPRHEHALVLHKITGWLRPGGFLVVTMGASATEAGYEEDWLGAPMYWSHFDSATNRSLVEDAGFDELEATESATDEDGEPVMFLWLVAQKPAGRGDVAR